MNIWKGNKVRLRAFEPDDGNYNFDSWNNSETLKMRDIPKLPASYNITSFFAGKDSENGPLSTEFHFIIENLKGDIVGDIGTGSCDQRNGTFTFGYEINEKYRRNGFASESILMVLRYYFFGMRFNKAWASVYSFNDASMKLLEKLGFKKEGIQSEMVYLNGNFYDKHFYGITFAEFDKIYGDEYKI